MTQEKVAIVVLNYNGLADTVKCLESLRAATFPAIKVILVDNGSEIDPEVEARAILPDLTVIKTGENLGYAGGNNRGIAAALDAGANFVLILNNDTIVSPNLVNELVDACLSDPRIGVLGPLINFMAEPAQLMTEGVRFNIGPGVSFFTPAGIAPSSGGMPVAVDIVNGCCMMLSRELCERVGTFDERLFIVHEESDLCLRAKAAGLVCAVLPSVLVWHKGSSAFIRTGRLFQRYYDTRNLVYLIVRHAGRGKGNRSKGLSLWQCVKYAYYRYCVERDAGQTLAAQAVVDGLMDATRGTFGQYRVSEPRRRSAVERIFEFTRWWNLSRALGSR